MSATSETLSNFIYRGKFQMADFYQNVLYGENSNFPNVVIFIPLERKLCTEQLLQQNYTLSPDVEREFPVLQRSRYSNCFLSFY